jgi:uncharacterized phage protein (TIGR02218 family)
MSYPVIEISRDDARPIELYHFAYTLNNWYYTSADRAITYNSNVYAPAPISSSSRQSTSDPTKANLTITMAGDSPIGDIFRVQPPSEPVIVTIFGEHYLDGSIAVLWKGRVTGSEWMDGSLLKLTVESIFSSLQRPGLRRRYQYGCPFALYGEDCGVPRDDWKEEYVVTSISGPTLIIGSTIGKPAQWYAGGYATWINDTKGNTERRMIRSSDTVTGAIDLSAMSTGLHVGQPITLYPGCDHTLEGANGCAPKFNNFRRYGGTPYIPTKNPFNGTSVY